MMSIRTERHLAMALEGIAAHQAMTAAHIAGITPKPRNTRLMKPGMTFYTTVSGEHVLSPDKGFGVADSALNELKIYWPRIPDFGIKSFEIYPGEDGWLQYTWWGGTGVDGTKHQVEEAARILTDADFQVTRAEAIIEGTRWLAVAAYAQGKSPGEFTVADYHAAVGGKKN